MPTATKTTTEAVLAALGGNPKATVAELSEATGLARSTVARCLAALEAAGAVSRVPGGREGSRRLADRWEAGEPRPTPTLRTESTGGAAPRLAKGALGALVSDYLDGHREPLGTTAIAKALGRSGGAVSNALERLVAVGLAETVGERPRRYVARDASPEALGADDRVGGGEG